MTNYVTIGEVYDGNLIENKKINICAIFMCFLYRKNAKQNI